MCGWGRVPFGLGLLGLAMALSGCDLLQNFVAPAYPPKEGTSPEGVQRVELTLQEWAIVPATVRVKAGTIRFVVHNAGTVAHGLEVEGVLNGQPFEEEIDPFPPGQTRTLELELPPGRYELYCQVPGHRELGMEGELIVEE